MTSPCLLRYEQKQQFRNTSSSERREAINNNTTRRFNNGEITKQTELSAKKTTINRGFICQAFTKQ